MNLGQWGDLGQWGAENQSNAASITESIPALSDTIAATYSQAGFFVAYMAESLPPMEQLVSLRVAKYIVSNIDSLIPVFNDAATVRLPTNWSVTLTYNEQGGNWSDSQLNPTTNWIDKI